MENVKFLSLSRLDKMYENVNVAENDIMVFVSGLIINLLKCKPFLNAKKLVSRDLIPFRSMVKRIHVTIRRST